MKWVLIGAMFFVSFLFGDEPFSQEAYFQEVISGLPQEARVALVGKMHLINQSAVRISCKELSVYCQEHDEETFDVIFVQVEGNFHEILRTLFYLRLIAHPETLLVAQFQEDFALHSYAWERCLEKGLFEEVASFCDGKGAVFKEGRFL